MEGFRYLGKVRNCQQPHTIIFELCIKITGGGGENWPPPRLLLAFYKAENEQKAFCSFAIFGHKTWDLEGGVKLTPPQAYPGFQVPQQGRVNETFTLSETLCNQGCLLRLLTLNALHCTENVVFQALLGTDWQKFRKRQFLPIFSFFFISCGLSITLLV